LNDFWFAPELYFDLVFMRIIAVTVQMPELMFHSLPELQNVVAMPDEFFRPIVES